MQWAARAAILGGPEASEHVCQNLSALALEVTLVPALVLVWAACSAYTIMFGCRVYLVLRCL